MARHESAQKITRKFILEMCLAYPYKIISVKGKKAVSEVSGREYEIKLDLLPKTKVGDWVMVSNKLAISKISNKEAEKIINILKSFK